MIEILVDPAADLALDLREIEHHAVRIEVGGFEREHGAAVVSVQVAALAGIVQQPMAVAKVEFS